MIKQDFFSEVSKGTNMAYVPVNEWKPAFDLSNDEKEVINMFRKYGGNFYEHIICSIPTYNEIRAKIVLSLLRGYNENFYGKNTLLDIGGSEGELIKTICTYSTAWSTYNLEPNREMIEHFGRIPVNSGHIIPYAFYEGFDGIDRHYNQSLYDVVLESMTFQFMGNGRVDYIRHVKDAYLKPNGLFICLEKVIPYEGMNFFIENEKLQDYYKSNFFTEEQIKVKRTNVVNEMHSEIVGENYLTECLKGQFHFVNNFWQAGNFVGYACSNSLPVLENFISGINFSSAYTERKL